MIATELTRYNSGAKFFFTISRPFLKSVPQGAATSVYCATQPGLEKEAGECERGLIALPRGSSGVPLWPCSDSLSLSLCAQVLC